jgi:hypothetical protein
LGTGRPAVYRFSKRAVTNTPHCPTRPFIEQGRRPKPVEMRDRGDSGLGHVVADLAVTAVTVVLRVADTPTRRDRRHSPR